MSQQYRYPLSSILALPGGSATSANQLLEIVELQNIEADVEAMSAKLPATLGQKPMTESLSVAIASDQSTLPISAASLPLPSGASTSALQITGNSSLSSIDAKLTAPLSVIGPLTDAQLRASAVPISAASLPLPSGAATEATSAAILADTADIEIAVESMDVKTPALVGGRVPVDGSGVTQPISAASLPLPSGAATSALQTSGNASLVSIDAKLTAPLSVTGPLTDTQLRASPVPVSGTVTANLGTIAGVATEATLSNLDSKVIAVDTGAVVVASSALPSGASTSALQTTGNASLSSIDSKTPALGQALMAASSPVVIASDQSPVSVVGPLTDAELRATAVPASQSGTWDINDITGVISLPTGASTAANQVLEIGELQDIEADVEAMSAKLPLTLGQKPMAASLAVVLASDQSSIPVAASQAGTWNINDISGTITLPSGAATAANQVLEISELQDIEADVEAMSLKLPATLGQKTMANSLAVVLASDQSSIPVAASQSGTWNITDITGVVSLPTGASTSALQTAANASLVAIDAALPTTLGQTTMAGSLAVTIASDQASIPVAATPVVPPALTVKQAAIAVGTTAVRLTTDGAAPSATRRVLMANTNSNDSFYIGSASVTPTGATRGILLEYGQTFEVTDDAGDYYIVCDSAGQTIFVMEQE